MNTKEINMKKILQIMAKISEAPLLIMFLFISGIVILLSYDFLYFRYSLITLNPYLLNFIFVSSIIFVIVLFLSIYIQKNKMLKIIPASIIIIFLFSTPILKIKYLPIFYFNHSDYNQEVFSCVINNYNNVSEGIKCYQKGIDMLYSDKNVYSDLGKDYCHKQRFTDTQNDNDVKLYNELKCHYEWLLREDKN